MKKSILIAITIAGLFGIPSLSFAEGWTNATTVTSFWCPGEDSCLVYGNFANSKTPQCSAPNAMLIDGPSFKKTFSMVLLSYTTGKNFKCWVNECQDTQGSTFMHCFQAGME